MGTLLSELDIKNRLNQLGKHKKPYFKFVEYLGKNQRNKHIAKVKSLETGEEKVINDVCRYFCDKTNPFGSGSKLSLNSIKLKVNKIGQKSNPKFEFIEDTGKVDGTTRLIRVKNEYGDEVITRMGNLFQGINPWGKKRPIVEIKNRVNKLGKVSNPEYEFVKDTNRLEGTDRIIKVKLLHTGEIQEVNLSRLIRGSVPWKIKYTNKEVEIFVNKVGGNSVPRFKFIKVKGRNSHKKLKVEVMNIKTKETRITKHSSIMKGHNPFFINGYTKKENKIRVNKIGRSSSPRFRVVKIGRKHKKDYKILVESANSKKQIWTNLRSLLAGSNPFNQLISRHEEEVVHPQIINALKKLGYKVESEVFLSRYSRVDIVATDNQGKKYIIEVKNDPGVVKTNWSDQELTAQKRKYVKDGKKKYGKLYKGFFFVSPKGLEKQCLSLDQLVLNI